MSETAIAELDRRVTRIEGRLQNGLVDRVKRVEDKVDRMMGRQMAALGATVAALIGVVGVLLVVLTS